jgi:hypothetical protein
VACGAFATVGAGVGYGGGGEDWTCSGFGTERTFGISRLDSIGGGSGGSPDFRNPCPGAEAGLPAAFSAAGAAAGTDAAGASPDAGAGAGGDGDSAGTVPALGVGCAALVTSGTGGGGGGGAGADTAEKPARYFSSLYFAFVRSAIRLCVSFSRSAAVNARLGGGGTVARFG